MARKRCDSFSGILGRLLDLGILLRMGQQPQGWGCKDRGITTLRRIFDMP